MFELSQRRRSRYLVQVATSAVVASALAGCSSDVSRFVGATDNQRSIMSGVATGPSVSSDMVGPGEVTGSVRTGTVSRTALPPAPRLPQATYTPPSVSAPVYQPPVYQPPVYQPPAVQAPVYQPPVVQAPTYTPPQMTAPHIAAPHVTAPMVTAPQVAAPQWTPPQVSAPQMTAPQVSAPQVSAPQWTPPQVMAPQVSAPRPPTATPPTIQAPVVQAPVVQAPSVTAPMVAAVDPGITGSAAAARPSTRSGWTAAGGTPVVLRAGETVDTLSHRYGVPRDAILRTNNLASPNAAVPGQQIIIPTFVAAQPSAPAPVAQAPAPIAPTPIAPAPIAQAPAPIAPARTAETRAPAAPAPASATHKVVAGDTLTRVARLYKVSAQDIRKANGLTTDQIRIGQTLTIPGLSPTQARMASLEAARRSSGTDATVTGATPPASTASRTTPVRTVPITTVTPSAPPAPTRAATPAPTPATPPARTAAPAPAPQPTKPLATTQAPSGTVRQVPAITPPPPAVATAPAAPAATPAPSQAKPPQVARLEPPKPAEPPKKEEPAATTSTAAPNFRRPVDGRIIREFGQKPNGERSEGINIAVPEGTLVKAAEEGEVIYAGNELKGYGNLVLVRHANGWVSAYGHNSDLLVKRGDKVARGQPISKSGSTGGVKEPQLHFEVRKGQRPVDPKPLLAGN